MKLSIVTISFNQARFLEQAIESVLSQDYPAIEYIVVDAGSTDGSREIIEKYKDRLASVIFEPDAGPADGLNKGFAKATGDIFFYLNADDVLLPGALRIAAKYFAAAPEVDVIYGNGVQIDAQGRKTRRIYSSKWGLRAYAFGAASVIQQATFFRKAAFARAGGFNVSNRTCWDGELLVDMALQGARFMKIREFIGEFRIYEESISGSGRLNNRYVDENKRVVEKILRRSPRQSDAIFRIFYRLLKHAGNPGVFVTKLWRRIVTAHG